MAIFDTRHDSLKELPCTRMKGFQEWMPILEGLALSGWDSEMAILSESMDTYLFVKRIEMPVLAVLSHGTACPDISRRPRVMDLQAPFRLLANEGLYTTIQRWRTL
jgi:hypothetical protein